MDARRLWILGLALAVVACGPSPTPSAPPDAASTRLTLVIEIAPAAPPDETTLGTCVVPLAIAGQGGVEVSVAFDGRTCVASAVDVAGTG